MDLELEIIRVHKPYTVETVYTALTCFATLGSYEAASEACGIPKPTIHDWHRRFPGHYQKIARQLAPQLEATVITAARGCVLNAAAGVNESVDLSRTQMRTGEVKDAAATGRNLATIVGIMTDKLLLLEGRPTSITETRTGDETLRAAEALGILTVESTATEISETQTPAVSIRGRQEQTHASLST